jgi:hypothetical protein
MTDTLLQRRTPTVREDSSLLRYGSLPHGGFLEDAMDEEPRPRPFSFSAVTLMAMVLGTVAILTLSNVGFPNGTSMASSLHITLLSQQHHHSKKKKEHHHNHHHHNDTAPQNVTTAEIKERCDWVSKVFVDKYFWVTEDEKKQQYRIATQDPNVFYRATANIFWVDYVQNGWGK